MTTARPCRVVVVAGASPHDPAAVGGVSGFLRALERVAPPEWVLLAPSADGTDSPETLGPSLYGSRLPHRLLFPLRLLRRLGRLVHLEPDVVYTHSNEAAMLLCILRRLGLFRAALVHHQHGSENPLRFATFRLGRLLFLPGLYDAVLRRTHRAVDHIIVIDKMCLEMNTKWGVPGSRMTLLSNAVDTEVYRPSAQLRETFREAERIPKDAFLFAFAGRLEEVKRIHLILGALRLLEGGAWLVVAGDGSLRSGLVRLAGSEGVADRTIFTGPLDSAAMPSLYAAADCLVLPSAAEGVPLVILEAMAAGIPVVATAVGGVTELLDPGSGIILSPDITARELADAMEAARRATWDPAAIRSGAGSHSGLAAVSILSQVFASVAARGRQRKRKSL